MLIAQASQELNIGGIAMNLFGGLALFLFGLDQMSDALKLIAGNGMKRILAKLTTNRFTGVFAGAFVTSVIQSSSITTVLTVGFISAGLMTLQQSIGVILGANIGTTITAQIIVFKITHYSLIMVSVGFLMLFASRNEKIKHYGHMLMGLGLIFFGMQLMSEGTSPLREYEPFVSMMRQMDIPVLGILLAAVFTGLVQSSSATTGIVIVLASQGFISLEAGIALIFGANIGTCVTALLASIGKTREAVRASVIHILFNVGGVIIWFPFISPLAELVTLISPSQANLEGTAKLAAETPRQIANAHTIFNVANALLFIWFTRPMAWLVCRLVPEKLEETDDNRPLYLDELLIRTPSLAVDIVRMEMGRLGYAALRMVKQALETVVKGNEQQLQELEDMDNDVDLLHGAIVTYLGRLSQENLGNRQSQQLQQYLSAANYMENIGDVIETNLVETGRDRLKYDLAISPKTLEYLSEFHEKVCWSVESAIKALVSNDLELAAQVLEAKSDISRLADRADDHLARRLSAREPNRLAAFRVESEIIEYLKRMFYFAKRICKLVAEPIVQETESDQTESHQTESGTESLQSQLQEAD